MSHLNDRIDKITDQQQCFKDIIEMANGQKWIKYDGSSDVFVWYTTYVVNYDILWEVEKLHNIVEDIIEYRIRIVDEITRFSSYILVDQQGNISTVTIEAEDGEDEDEGESYE